MILQPIGTKNTTSVGTHLLLDFFEVPVSLLIDAEHLAQSLLDAAYAAGATPLSAPVLHRFPGGGLTGFLPLSESHLAFHTYPERGYMAADLFTCSSCPPEAAAEVLRERLNPGHMQVHRVVRGMDNGFVHQELSEAPHEPHA